MKIEHKVTQLGSGAFSVPMTLMTCQDTLSYYDIKKAIKKGECKQGHLIKIDNLGPVKGSPYGSRDSSLSILTQESEGPVNGTLRG